MESYNPTSQINSQSNIVPFNTDRPAKLNRADSAEQSSIWERFWDGLFRMLIPTSEPRITQKQGRNGSEYYQVYDPTTGTSKTFGSELETRIWLDRRFYQ